MHRSCHSSQNVEHERFSANLVLRTTPPNERDKQPVIRLQRLAAGDRGHDAGLVRGAGEPASVGINISLQLTGSASCTDNGERAIVWQAHLVGLDTLEQQITLFVVFSGTQSGSLPIPYPGVTFDPHEIDQTYPGGSSSLDSTATSTGDGAVTGAVRMDASALAGDLNHAMVNNTYPASAIVDLVDPCSPTAPIAVEPTQTDPPAKATTRPAFTG